MAVDLTVPNVGESISEVMINRWLKGEGDRVEKDETIAELETDKATFELPAPAAGTLSGVSKKQGETASVGEVIGRIEEGAAQGNGKRKSGGSGDGRGQPQKIDQQPSANAKAEPDKSEEQAAPEQEAAPALRQGGGEQIETEPRIMPAARKALIDHGLRAEQVKATGPGGRLLKEDVIRHVAQQHDESEADRAGTTVGTAREEQVVAMSPMRQTIARRLVEAQQTAALLTTFNEVDMTSILALRKRYKDDFAEQYDAKLGFMSFFIKAVVDALRRFPAINAEIREGRKIAYRNYFDIGIAVSTPKGLTVPVVRNAESMSFAEIEQQVLDFAQRGQVNKIELKELEGGTFTITNGGVFGSLLSTPIVNPPQSGVLGMHAIQQRPVAIDGQVVVRPMMYTALTYDHRIVDGREAVSFLKRVKECIEDPARMLMEV